MLAAQIIMERRDPRRCPAQRSWAYLVGTQLVAEIGHGVNTWEGAGWLDSLAVEAEFARTGGNRGGFRKADQFKCLP